MWKRFANLTLKQGRRLVIAVIGGTVVLIGLALLVLPGPGMVVIPLGLAILATEFIWARRLLRELRRRAGVAVNGARRWFGGRPPDAVARGVDGDRDVDADDGEPDAPEHDPFEHPSGPASTDHRNAA